MPRRAAQQAVWSSQIAQGIATRGLSLLALILGLFLSSADADAATGAAGADALHIATLVPLGAVCPQGFMEASAFARRLKELGYDPLALIEQHCFGELADLPRLTAELLKDKPSLVVVWGSAAATQLVRQAAPLMPIVFVDVAEPVESGLVDSLSHPGRNMTGISNNTDELIAKRVQILREALPQATRLGILVNLANRFQTGYLRTVQEAARTLNWETRTYDVRSEGDLAGAFAAMRQDGVDSMMLQPDSWFFPFRGQIIELARRYRLPAMYGNSAYPDLGALFTYGANLDDMQYRAAMYVDKLLKGAKPADLPVEQPALFDFVVNARTARELGLTLPATITLRATRVID